MKQKEFYNCHFQTYFNEVINKWDYKKAYWDRNDRIVEDQFPNGKGFRHLKLDYDLFAGFQLRMKRNLKFSAASEATNIAYTYIIEKSLFDSLTNRFNLGIYQLFDLKDKMVDTENEYVLIFYYYNNLQDLNFEKSRFHFYISETGQDTFHYEECTQKILSKEMFQDIKFDRFENGKFKDLRIEKRVFNESYFDHDVLIITEFETEGSGLMVSVDMAKYLEEQNAKILFYGPETIYYE